MIGQTRLAGLRSLRARVTLVSTAVLLVVLAAAGWGIVELVDRQLRDELAEQNAATLDRLRSRIEAGEDPATMVLPLATDGTEYIVSAADGTWVNSTVTVVTEVQEFDEFDELVADQDSEEEIPFELNLTEVSQVRAEAPDGNAYLIEAISPTVIVERAVGQVRSALLLVVPLLAALFAVLVWLLAGRLLRPVDRMAAQARQIGNETLGDRIERPGTDDEIDRLAATLNDMLDRLEQGARAQRQFVSDASHELQSPLTVLLGEAELAAASDDPDQWREANTRVVEYGTEMMTLIGDLLDLARSDEASLRRVEVDLDDVVRAQAGGRLEPVDTTGVEPVRLVGDARSLARLVRNLVDNAVRHGGPEVAVTCRIEADHTALLIVDDAGPGIPPEQRAVVFDRFARLDHSRTKATGGSGLGLAIVAAIAKAHHGSVEIGDSPLGGARFTVRLPRMVDASGAPAPQPI